MRHLYYTARVALGTSIQIFVHGAARRVFAWNFAASPRPKITTRNSSPIVRALNTEEQEDELEYPPRTIIWTGPRYFCR